jgi:hypothetical protein
VVRFANSYASLSNVDSQRSGNFSKVRESLQVQYQVLVVQLLINIDHGLFYPFGGQRFCRLPAASGLTYFALEIHLSASAGRKRSVVNKGGLETICVILRAIDGQKET